MVYKAYTHQRTKSAQVHGFIAFNFSKPKTSILSRCFFFCCSSFYWISRMKRKWAAKDNVCNMCYMNSYGSKHHRLEVSNLASSCFKHAQLPNTHTLCARVPLPNIIYCNARLSIDFSVARLRFWHRHLCRVSLFARYLSSATCNLTGHLLFSEWTIFIGTRLSIIYSVSTNTIHQMDWFGYFCAQFQLQYTKLCSVVNERIV